MSETKEPRLNLFQIRQIALVVMTILFALIIAASLFIISSPYAPLIVFAGAIFIISLFACLKRPVWALYVVLLVVLLPIGLFPAIIQSNLNRFLTVVALAVWVLSVIIQRRKIVFTKSALFMLGFLVWCLLTLLWAQNPEAAKNALGGYTLRFVLFFILIANEINTRKTLDGLMHTLSLAGWVFIIAGTVTIISQGYEVGA